MNEAGHGNAREYKALYHVVGGESHGFGLKQDYEGFEREKFTAGDSLEAVKTAYSRAKHMADDYLSNTEGKTIVKIIELVERGGLAINVFEEIRKAVPSAEFEAKKQFVFPDGIHLTVERTLLDHLLTLMLEKKSEES